MSTSIPHQPELPPALASDICTAFDLGEPLNSQKIPSGLMHANYFLETATGNYVTRLLGYVDMDILSNERHVQAQLRYQDVPATYMLTANNGDFLHTTHDTNVTVAEKLAGSHPGRPAADADCFAVGQALGNFHEVVKSVSYSNERFALVGRDSTAYRITKLAERGSDVASNLNRLHRDHAPTVFDADLPQGILHGDFHSENALVHDGTVAILDLETTFRGPFVLDIGRSLLDLCHRPSGAGMDEQKIDHFLRGYEQVRSLTSQEQDVLPSAITFACVGVASWLYLKKHGQVGKFFLGIASERTF